MNISAQDIWFRGHDNVYKLQLENTSPHPLIFKIKITNNDLFSIAPGKGIITSSQNASITIKLIKICDFSAKLLISYALPPEINTETSLSIDQQWSRLNEKTIQNTIIPINRKSQRELAQKKEEKPAFKKTDSPTYETEINNQEREVLEGNNFGKREAGSKSSVVMKQSSNMYRSVQDLDKRESNLSISRKGQSERLQKELERERQVNKRMTESLIEKEKKIIYFSNMQQVQINKSMDRHEEEVEWGCSNLLLAAFILIMVGFFLSRYDLPLHFSL